MAEKKKFQVRGLVTNDVILNEFEVETREEALELMERMEFPCEYNDGSSYLVGEDDDLFEGPRPWDTERPYLGD